MAVSADIEGLLRSLSSRPNVHSTLILSRKNGSIIRASGAPANTASLTSSKPSMNAEVEDKNGEDDEEVTEARKTPQTSEVDKLAQAVFDFVSTATGLSSVMSSISSNTSAHSRSHSGSGLTAKVEVEENVDKESRDTENNDVQLLRMRTKRQEIIIYPDTKFLCCVVQNITRSNSGPDNR